MRRVRWSISAAAILLAALFYFFDARGVASALVPAALAHELGHVLALRLCARRLTRVRVGLTGVELDYAPGLDGPRRALCCLAGPMAGFLYAFVANALGGAFLHTSGAVSLLLSCFNLLPVLPLDGGRIVDALAPGKTARLISHITAFIVALFGAFFAVRYASFTVLFMGVWLCAGTILRHNA